MGGGGGEGAFYVLRQILLRGCLAHGIYSCKNHETNTRCKIQFGLINISFAGLKPKMFLYTRNLGQIKNKYVFRIK